MHNHILNKILKKLNRIYNKIFFNIKTSSTDIHENNNYEYIDIKKNFNIDKLLPESYISGYSTADKIKVRFFHNSSVSSWNYVESLCSALEKDYHYDVKVIIVEDKEFMNNKIAQMSYFKHNIVYINDYKIENDLPDVLIIYMFTFELSKRISEWRAFYKQIIFIYPSVIWGGWEAEPSVFFECWMSRLSMLLPHFSIMDNYLYELAKKLYDNNFFGDLINLPNPAFDRVYQGIRESGSKKWDKIKEMKIIVISCSHNVMVKNGITIDLYLDEILKYAKNNTDVAFVLKPHSKFFKELIEYQIWTQNDLNLFKMYIESSPNLILDESFSEDVYGIADGFLVDETTEMRICALPTRKPICIMRRYDTNTNNINPDESNFFYQAFSKEDLISFVDMVINDKDPMLDKREQLINMLVCTFDGQNGERIKQFIDSIVR